MLDVVWDWTIPVNIDSLSKKVVFEYSELESDIAAIISPSKGFYRISVNSFLGEHARNFSKAYVLAYLIKNNVNSVFNINKSDFIYEENNLSNKKEIQELALKLLMPDDALNYFIVVKGINNVSDLSKVFSVSEYAVYYRTKSFYKF